MADAFTLIGGKDHQETVYDDYEDQLSGKTSSQVVSCLASVRAHHPDMTVAVNILGNINLLAFAAAGLATAELDSSEDNVIRLRFFLPPASHYDDGGLTDGMAFARYNYTFQGLKFILYIIDISSYPYQFICFPPDSDETVRSNSKATDALLLAAGRAIYGPYQDYVAVFDGYWRADVALYKEVQKTGWNDVILDLVLRDAISRTIEEFYDNESRYRDLDVPWKRGIIFHGPPGNGKTISLRALMHSLISNEKKRPKPINLLYVKSITSTYAIRLIFTFARAVAPCLLIIEDIDTQVTPDKLSYFFNEVDGLENNDGILMIATTNHLDKLDEGLKRPSRFDRRYLFPLPQLDERKQYSEFWRKKLNKNEAKVDFPKKLSSKIARITDGFSFATMKEAFIASLLSLARQDDDKREHGEDKDDDDIGNLPLWKEIQIQVKLLRKEMEKAHRVSQPAAGYQEYVTREECMSRLAPAQTIAEQLASEGVPARDPGTERTLTWRDLDPRSISPGSNGPLRVDDYAAWKHPAWGPSTLPIRPPPPAMRMGSSNVPVSYPDVPLLAGPSPSVFPSDYNVPGHESRNRRE